MPEALTLGERTTFTRPEPASAKVGLDPRWRTVAVLGAIMLVGLALRLYEFRGFGAADDAAYAQVAHQIAEGTFEPGTYEGPAVFPLRLGIIYPTALLFRHFGVSEWTMVLFPFFISLLSILLAYVATSHFFGRGAGLIGAALWAFLPLDTFHAGVLVPDLVAAFFGSLGVVAVILLADSRVGNRQLLFMGGLGAGIAFGVSWLSKESVAYLVPFCIFLVITTLRRDWKRHLPIWAGVALGSIGVLAAEMLYYQLTTGDWLFHVHETERNYRQYKNAFFVSGSSQANPEGGSYARAVVRRLVLGGPTTILLSAQFLYLPLLAGVVCLHALYWRNRAFLIAGVWFLSLVFMFNFASSSLSSYVPLVLFERYLYPIFLPAVILVAGFLASLLLRPDRRQGTAREGVFWGALLVGCLLLVGVFKHRANAKYYPGWASEARELSRTLRPTDRIYTDIASMHGLEFFWSYPGRMNMINFEDMDEAEPMRIGEYVLVNSSYLSWLESKGGWWPTQEAVYERPAFARAAPESWERIWSNGNASLYRVR